ncbi:hypothetical protein PPERSA_06466 [Pseudocohnilembus persalinus]|uniref:Uncharacterized protein n=1 Tax=Pseudocohnilembus persalinus TaxID=266149 RepID=A0A0V0QS44_PSEPJ|nr:hypothetical protein PPERSA_06466 [Pseudocohnilembus persalinus]|eukprot:KRX04832.1 hypothetical protein PPERSA_06466 [Pseudocohnilembus persalinus]
MQQNINGNEHYKFVVFSPTKSFHLNSIQSEITQQITNKNNLQEESQKQQKIGKNEQSNSPQAKKSSNLRDSQKSKSTLHNSVIVESSRIKKQNDINQQQQKQQQIKNHTSESQLQQMYDNKNFQEQQKQPIMKDLRSASKDKNQCQNFNNYRSNSLYSSNNYIPYKYTTLSQEKNKNKKSTCFSLNATNNQNTLPTNTYNNSTNQSQINIPKTRTFSTTSYQQNQNQKVSTNNSQNFELSSKNGNNMFNKRYEGDISCQNLNKIKSQSIKIELNPKIDTQNKIKPSKIQNLPSQFYENSPVINKKYQSRHNRCNFNLNELEKSLEQEPESFYQSTLSRVKEQFSSTTNLKIDNNQQYRSNSFSVTQLNNVSNCDNFQNRSLQYQQQNYKKNNLNITTSSTQNFQTYSQNLSQNQHFTSQSFERTSQTVQTTKNGADTPKRKVINRSFSTSKSISIQQQQQNNDNNKLQYDSSSNESKINSSQNQLHLNSSSCQKPKIPKIESNSFSQNSRDNTSFNLTQQSCKNINKNMPPLPQSSTGTFSFQKKLLTEPIQNQNFISINDQKRETQKFQKVFQDMDKDKNKDKIEKDGKQSQKSDLQVKKSSLDLKQKEANMDSNNDSDKNQNLSAKEKLMKNLQDLKIEFIETEYDQDLVNKMGEKDDKQSECDTSQITVKNNEFTIKNSSVKRNTHQTSQNEINSSKKSEQEKKQKIEALQIHITDELYEVYQDDVYSQKLESQQSSSQQDHIENSSVQQRYGVGDIVRSESSKFDDIITQTTLNENQNRVKNKLKENTINQISSNTTHIDKDIEEFSSAYLTKLTSNQPSQANLFNQQQFQKLQQDQQNKLNKDYIKNNEQNYQSQKLQHNDTPQISCYNSTQNNQTQQLEKLEQFKQNQLQNYYQYQQQANNTQKKEQSPQNQQYAQKKDEKNQKQVPFISLPQPQRSQSHSHSNRSQNNQEKQYNMSFQQVTQDDIQKSSNLIKQSQNIGNDYEKINNKFDTMDNLQVDFEEQLQEEDRKKYQNVGLKSKNTKIDSTLLDEEQISYQLNDTAFKKNKSNVKFLEEIPQDYKIRHKTEAYDDEESDLNPSQRYRKLKKNCSMQNMDTFNFQIKKPDHKENDMIKQSMSSINILNLTTSKGGYNQQHQQQPNRLLTCNDMINQSYSSIHNTSSKLHFHSEKKMFKDQSFLGNLYTTSRANLPNLPMGNSNNACNFCQNNNHLQTDVKIEKNNNEMKNEMLEIREKQQQILKELEVSNDQKKQLGQATQQLLIKNKELSTKKKEMEVLLKNLLLEKEKKEYDNNKKQKIDNEISQHISKNTQQELIQHNMDKIKQIMNTEKNCKFQDLSKQQITEENTQNNSSNNTSIQEIQLNSLKNSSYQSKISLHKNKEFDLENQENYSQNQQQFSQKTSKQNSQKNSKILQESQVLKDISPNHSLKKQQSKNSNDLKKSTHLQNQNSQKTSFYQNNSNNNNMENIENKKNISNNNDNIDINNNKNNEDNKNFDKKQYLQENSDFHQVFLITQENNGNELQQSDKENSSLSFQKYKQALDFENTSQQQSYTDYSYNYNCENENVQF